MESRQKNPPFKLRSTEEMQSELAQISDEQERLGWFEQLVKDLDKSDELNDLKHFRKNRRHEFDPHYLDMTPDEEVSVPPLFRTLNNSDEWLDYIFSKSPDDLHELVEDEALCKALRGLGRERREALFYRVVHGYSSKETAAFQGVSDRNVRKLVEKAIKEVRDAIDKETVGN